MSGEPKPESESQESVNRAFGQIFRFVYKEWLTVLILLMVLSVVMSSGGLAIRAFFDSIVESDFNLAWSAIVIFISLQAARIVINLLGVYGDVTLRMRVNILLIKNMLNYVLMMPGAKALAVPPAQAITHFRDDTRTISEFFDHSGFLKLFTGSWWMILNSIILWTVSPPITLLVLMPLVLVFLVAKAARGRIEMYRRINLESTENVTGFIGEMVAAVQAIQVANANEPILEHFKGINEQRRSAALMDRVFTNLIQSISHNFGNISTGLVLMAAAPMMADGSFTIGDFALFSFNFHFIAMSAKSLGETVTKYQQAQVSMERIKHMMFDESYDVLTQAGPLYIHGDPPPIERQVSPQSERFQRLELKDLSYYFDDGSVGIEGIDLEIERGQFTVITGRVGSGKTTLLRTLLGLYPLASGEILWNGEPIRDPADFFIPPHSAYTPQIPILFSDSLEDNILMGLEKDERGLWQSIIDSQMEADIAQLEMGLQTMVGPRGVKLSGGQKQRSAAARMLITKADLMVFDDISSALDITTEQALWKSLLSNKDLTFLAVSHRPAALERADQIILLKAGRVQARGTLAELLEESEEIREMMQGWEEEVLS